MKNSFILYLFFLSISMFSQKDSLQIGDSYWEDQLYLNISFTALTNQPQKLDKKLHKSGFSFGFSAGYIRDIPVVKSGKIAIGIGLGYGFDSFNHSLKVIEGDPTGFKIDKNITTNKLKTHNIEIPIQFRLRTSTQNSYAFWRLYTGIKFSYNLKNTFSYMESDSEISLSNLAEYHTFQTGLTLSAGYKTFNFHAYYGITPILKNTYLHAHKIKTNIVRIGLSFYLL
ncbi:porin family protein [Tenacibaculum piscium]|uniref:porin family protein n=2 Tax=Tenacibaculum piscium TaxID=1458515 RepID=UPI001F2E28A3|nr:porin family protein [Tenacibaculum piscium]